MNITDVKVRLSPVGSSLLGIAAITVDNELQINDIKIYPAKGSDIKIVFPNNQITEQHNKKNIVPLTHKTWVQIKGMIKKEYKKQKTAQIDLSLLYEA